jgi:RluA family pseudouridine synthase
MERSLDLQVDQGDLGARVDRFVAGRVRSLSRTFVADLVERGLVLVNGVPARRVSQRLHEPGSVLVRLPGADEPAVDLASRVLHCDEALLAIDKPAGLPVSARLSKGGEDAVGAARRLLLGRGLDASFLGTPHRLDRATSGVLLLARTREAARSLSASFASRRTRKTYLAWVEGVVAADSGAIDAPIHAPGDGAARIDPELGRAARTRFRVLGRGADRSLLALALLTGRTHQLRLHLAHVAHPIAGDPIHGTSADGGGERLLLHAWRLVVPHPGSGERLVIQAPPPFPIG